MLINLRNALMAGKRLPYDAEVEYIESTGTQYINTGIKPSPNTRVEITFAMTTFTANCGLFGARGTASADNNSYNLFIISNNGSRVRWDWSGSGQYQTSEADTSTEATYVLGAAGGTITRNGSTVMSVSASKAAINYPLYVFNFNNVGTPFSTGANARFWSVKIYEGQTLVFDAIPVRKGTVGYLYDRVSGKLFGNAGTGDFVLGPDVVPVEWLANGVAGSYINTGVASSKNISSKVDGIIFNPSVRGAGNFQFLYGKGTSWNYDSYALFFQTESTQTDVGRVSFHGHHDYLSPVLDSETHLSLLISANGTDTATITGDIGGEPVSKSASISGVSGYFSMLWARGLNQPNTIGLKQIEMYDGSKMIRKFRPVRVGTDATSWEGAMMDVLTRRVYRNAGTGAFTYGNDLRYPIPAE